MQRLYPRIGPQIAALDIYMRNPRPAGAAHLIARPHNMPPGPQLNLRRPVNPGEVIRHIHGMRRKSWNLGIDQHRRLRAHAVQRHRPGRDRHGVAVLHPQHHPLIGARCRQTGKPVGRPRIRVMGAGQRGPVIAGIGIQRVFHHIMSGHAHCMNKQLPGKRPKAELRADRSAIQHIPPGPSRRRRIPRRQHGPGIIIKPVEKPHAARPIPGPVIRRGQPRAEMPIIAEKHEIGGKIHHIQIPRRVGQHLRRQLRAIHRQHRHPRGQKPAQPFHNPPGIERRHQHAAHLGLRHIGQRARDMRAAHTAHRQRILHINTLDIEIRAQSQQRPGNPIGIENRGQPGLARKHAERRRRQRMRQRLIDHIAAAQIIEGLYIKHDLCL